MLTTREILRSLQGSHFFSYIGSDSLTLLAEVLEIERFGAGVGRNQRG